MINLYRNPELKAIMFENIKYWMDLGVDGFRFDAVTKLIEDERYLTPFFLENMDKKLLFSPLFD